MKKKKIYIFLTLTLLIAVVSGFWLKNMVTSGEDSLSYTVKKTLEIEKSNNKDIIAKVDGIPIYKKDLDIAELYEKIRFENQLKLGSVNKQNAFVTPHQKTKKELLDELIERKVLMESAKKEGFLVSKEEAEAYFNSVKNTIDDILNGKIKGDIESAKQARELLDTYKTQFPANEFNEKVIGAYQEILTISKYLKAKTDEYIKEHPNATAEEINQYLNDFKNRLKANSKIEVLS
ncbi:SurA N-terminal domain-containing protein [Caldicellulosiruptor morganii]|uniref:peptidylprolyl isomerase n=1 Tax=Caldicellulosiruptor morganii TaxID=1387555 RepID=A0ABY7BNE3_9FIRM|nr:SurA N-terminal domain-containing protein [Caldicellulosiruptor morganii]WAM33943.1 SurA N-terminal domain-containing protein [Caldicellulosiruptor morganii]